MRQNWLITFRKERQIGPTQQRCTWIGTHTSNWKLSERLKQQLVQRKWRCPLSFMSVTSLSTATKVLYGRRIKASGIAVANVTIPSGPSGRNRGFAFIRVADSKTAMQALDCPDLLVKGRRLVINEAHTPKNLGRAVRRTEDQETFTRLYVGNLTLNVTSESVLELFAGHGFRAVDVYIAHDSATKKPRGFAFVSMASQNDAANAIGALNGSIVDGQSIIVKPAWPRAAANPADVP